MSDIPFARACLQRALKSDDLKFVHGSIRVALRRLDREKPEFIAPKKLPPLTEFQVLLCRALRTEGYPLNEIARKVKTNIGRVSEAINGKRNGI